jgi:hypothetical protein
MALSQKKKTIQEEKTILNVYTLVTGIKYLRHHLIELQGEINLSRFAIGSLRTPYQ